METIKSFGKIYYNTFTFRHCPKNINEERKYVISGDNNNILTKISSDGYYCGTICENVLDKSIEEYKWKIKILTTKNNNIMVGVAPIDFDHNSTNYNTFISLILFSLLIQTLI